MKASERLYARAEHHRREGRLDLAFEACAKLVGRAPSHAGGWALLGELHDRRGDASQALQCFQQAATFDPGNAAIQNNLGLAQQAVGDATAAEASFRRALAIRPDHAKAHHNLGNALRQQGRREEAVGEWREALRLQPLYPQALNSLGATLRELRRHVEATDALRRALAIRPHYAKALFNLGNALADMEERDEALRCYRQAVALQPGYAKALQAEADLLARTGQTDAALACLESIQARSPDLSLARGTILRRAGRLQEACTAFEDAVAADPMLLAARGQRLELRSEQCHWRDRHEDVDILKQATAEALPRGEVPPLSASAAHRFVPCTPEEQLQIARDAASRISARLAPLRASLGLTHERRTPERLRIGYLSCDFRNNAAGHLTHGLFGLHDRRRFEVLAFSYGPDDGSRYRRRAEADADTFVDVGPLSHAESARRIHAAGVDILVDLVGGAGNGRLEICALRPAPVQVHFLGYPATTGASFIDYFIADRVVAPEGMERFFEESLVRLPGTYQVNDHEQEIAATIPRRQACGLPADGFVFACFNANYKIEPGIFDVWMRVLGRVPASVLWLLETSPASESNLRREAAARGVDPSRLVFARLVAKPDHLARHACADLFLDTPLCNAHTTASDALWAGLPVLTCPGQTFASRVAASLLTAVGLAELVVPDLSAYEETAVRLALQPEDLRHVRASLAVNRTTEPLFDTRRFVRGLERAYLTMWERHRAGQAPRSFDVPSE